MWSHQEFSKTAATDALLYNQLSEWKGLQFRKLIVKQCVSCGSFTILLMRPHFASVTVPNSKTSIIFITVSQADMLNEVAILKLEIFVGTGPRVATVWWAFFETISKLKEQMNFQILNTSTIERS
jgi:hypothetical protein